MGEKRRRFQLVLEIAHKAVSKWPTLYFSRGDPVFYDHSGYLPGPLKHILICIEDFFPISVNCKGKLSLAAQEFPLALQEKSTKM